MYQLEREKLAQRYRTKDESIRQFNAKIDEHKENINELNECLREFFNSFAIEEQQKQQQGTESLNEEHLDQLKENRQLLLAKIVDLAGKLNMSLNGYNSSSLDLSSNDG